MRTPWLVVFCAVAGCTGIIDAPSGVGGGDPTGPDAGDVDAPQSSSDGAGFTCRNTVTSVGSGNHNAGLDCMGGCHNHGFTLAGSLFQPGTTTPVVGASITVTDATGKSLDMVSQRNGNFYTSTKLTFPVTIAASSCPDVSHMTAQVSAGGCNSTGCHASGAQGSIHLP
jgi:hypothetical protein